MDALRLRCLFVAALLPAACGIAQAATYQTVNFAVTAKNPQVAEKVGKAAEVYRKQLAVFWLGKALPNWSRPCKIAVTEGALGAGGQTTFQFVKGEVLNWRMDVQGTLERILDSVLPHEINHTIFACHFRRPLPRWADEGAATLFEHRSEQLKQLALLNEVIKNKRELITLRDLLSMKEYPKGQRPMLTLYAEGYALADFLVQQKGRHAYLRFISDGERTGWDQAIKANFDHDGIESLEKNWRGWVLAGMPKLTLPSDQMLAAQENDSESKAQAAARPEISVSERTLLKSQRGKGSRPNGIVRSQSPDEPSNPVARESVPSTEAVSAQGESTSLAEAELLPNQPSAQTAATPRSAISAPVPRPGNGNFFQKEEVVPASRFSNSESSIEGAKVGNTHTSTSDQHQLLFGDSALPAEMEPTGVLKPEDDSTNDQRQKVNAGAFEFSGVLLPGERKANSGGTPQWAGFPGQKKLF